MIAGILMLAASFNFVATKDPFDDAITRIAEIGSEGKAQVRIMCGKDTHDKLIVQIEPGVIIYSNSFLYQYGRSQLVRFDDAEPIQMHFHYRDDDVLLIDDDARTFAQEVISSDRVRFQIIDYENRILTFDFPTAGATIAVPRVLDGCGKK